MDEMVYQAYLSPLTIAEQPNENIQTNHLPLLYSTIRMYILSSLFEKQAGKIWDDYKR